MHPEATDRRAHSLRVFLFSPALPCGRLVWSQHHASASDTGSQPSVQVPGRGRWPDTGQAGLWGPSPGGRAQRETVSPARQQQPDRLEPVPCTLAPRDKAEPEGPGGQQGSLCVDEPTGTTARQEMAGVMHGAKVEGCALWADGRGPSGLPRPPLPGRLVGPAAQTAQLGPSDQKDESRPLTCLRRSQAGTTSLTHGQGEALAPTRDMALTRARVAGRPWGCMSPWGGGD